MDIIINALIALTIGMLTITTFILFLWLINLRRRVKTLERWIRMIDKAVDPDGTGDVYIKRREEQ